MNKSSLWIIIMVLITLAVISGAFSLWLNARVFSGFDMSPMIDSGWRVYSGQVPGRDFLATFPFSLYVAAAICFHVFGVTWHALALGAVILFGCMLVLGSRLGALTRTTQGRPAALWSLSAFFAGQAIPLLVTTTLWHAPIASAFALYAVYASFVISGSGKPNRKVRVEALVHLTLAFAGLILSKPNIGIPTIIICLVVLWQTRVKPLEIIGVLGSACLLASMLLAYCKLNLISMFSAYAGLAGRLIPKGLFIGTFYQVHLIFALATLLVYAICMPLLSEVFLLCKRHSSTLLRQPRTVLGLGALLIAVLSMATNYQFKLADTPLMLLGITILCLQVDFSTPILRQRTLITGSALVLLAFYFGKARISFLTTHGWEDAGCRQVFFVDPFLGRLRACSEVPILLAEIDQTLSTRQHKELFFCPSLEFLYAGRHLQSPLHLPNWWDPGTSFPISRSSELTKAWKDHHFDLLIFPKSDPLVQLPVGIVQEIRENYVLVANQQQIDVYIKR